MTYRVTCSVLLLCFGCFVSQPHATAQIRRGTAPQSEGSKFHQEDKFRQLEEVLPTPNDYRAASGAPGHKYWQQKVDYRIDVKLNEDERTLSGSELITYQNNSPDTLKYLWLQLDGNRFAKNSDATLTETATSLTRVPFSFIPRMQTALEGGGGVDILGVKGVEDNQDLDHTIVKTMMRVDLPEPLKPGASYQFQVDWKYKIVDSSLVGSRGAFEYFEEDGNCIFEIAQWFPRLCAYNDVTGWQHKQFLGRGEFTLEFGDYIVAITVPGDHIVGATGELLNGAQVLTQAQRDRLVEAKTAEEPIFIVTPDEAKENQKEGSDEEQTWIFKADNVRDFAFASSRKFIWDAQGVDIMGNHVMAMSLYPNEAEPMWSKFSTHAIIHTLDVYSRFTFRYPYPVAYSVNGPIGGMEYPMICFNGPRPEKDGTYSERTKAGLVGVIIHEVGHNYFPMIVNSDERQWTWMDEGLNTFLQYLAEREWEEQYPTPRGEPRDIVGYMTSNNQVPIMTNSESILQFGPNAYSKPATALNILRETVMGRELFDFAFREYSQRWMFKRPMPADFFRSMEDASGVDLDWFWRGWFYTTDHVDLSIDDVRQFNIDTLNPSIEKKLQREEAEAEPKSLSAERNKEENLKFRSDSYPSIMDFYSHYDPLVVTDQEKAAYKRLLDTLSEEERKMLKDKTNFYIVDLSNVGGLVMPIILQFNYDDGTNEQLRVPAEIWRHDSESVSKMFVTKKNVVSVQLDPQLETADGDLENNHFPRQISKSRFQMFKGNFRRRGGGGNPMSAARLEQEAKKRAAEQAAAKEAEAKRKAEKEAADKAAAEKAAAEQAAEAMKEEAAEAKAEAAEQKEEAEAKESDKPSESASASATASASANTASDN